MTSTFTSGLDMWFYSSLCNYQVESRHVVSATIFKLSCGQTRTHTVGGTALPNASLCVYSW